MSELKGQLHLEYWKVAGVEQEPVVDDLKQWTIVPFQGEEYLFGWREDGSWRKSSPIVDRQYNIETRDWTFRTESGRIYHCLEEDRRDYSE